MTESIFTWIENADDVHGKRWYDADDVYTKYATFHALLGNGNDGCEPASIYTFPSHGFT